jgi:phosphoribosylanthranilate isomerase
MEPDAVPMIPGKNKWLGTAEGCAGNASNMWIKLCGNTSLEDARLCALAGATALGFIFAEHSTRYISPHQAESICHALAEEFPLVERVGVFTHGDPAGIAHIAEECALTALQLQSHETQKDAIALHTLAPQSKLIAAFPWAGGDDFSRRLAENTHTRVFDAFLVDSSAAQDRGGTGIPFHWEHATGCFADAAKQRLPAIAAGGLNAQNVTAAITVLRPWGVDAVSSVEAAPGVKDPTQVRAFVAAARAA